MDHRFICTVIFALSSGVLLGVLLCTYNQTRQISHYAPTNRGWQPGCAHTGTPFSTIAATSTPTTDKITTHSYGPIYDAYFTESTTSRPAKLLEIGLGCGMNYGPGASSNIWPKLFQQGDIWFAELDKACVDYHWNSTMPWRYVTGDQSDILTLKEWVNQTGGQFDFIIDDGGHTNVQIWNSFQVLFFDALKPGGTYFIEDLQVGRSPPYHAGGIPGSNGSALADALTEWVDQLVTGGLMYRNALPPEISRIDCIHEMCAITKAG